MITKKTKKCKNSLGEKVLCSATTGKFDAMPSADFTTKGLLAYFSKNFGFNAQETVAIMGAHNLGKAFRDHSGYRGAGGWHKDPTALNRGYYASLNLTTWNLTFVNNSDIPNMHDKYQWTAKNSNTSLPPFFMLNSDMAVLYDMDGYLNSTSGFVGCQIPRANPTSPVCPYAKQTYDSFVRYKFNDTTFLYDFRDVFNKMLTRGYNTSSGCPLPPCYL